MFEAKIPPPNFRRLDDDEGHWVETLVAYDAIEARAVFLRSCFSPLPGRPVGYFEFWFEILVVSNDDDREPFSVQDGRRSRGFVPDAVRRDVLECVCAGLEILVRDIRPVAIYRVVKSAGMPLKAMRKHEIVTDVLMNMGYRISRTGLDPARRTFWLMT